MSAICFVYGAITHIAGLSRPFHYITLLGWSHFARRYSGNLVWFLFLRVLRCFSSPRSPHTYKYMWWQRFTLPGFPIRVSMINNGYLLPHHGLSQVITPFIASSCQGIHRIRLVTWPYNPIDLYAWMVVVNTLILYSNNWCYCYTHAFHHMCRRIFLIRLKALVQ